MGLVWSIVQGVFIYMRSNDYWALKDNKNGGSSSAAAAAPGGSRLLEKKEQ